MTNFALDTRLTFLKPVITYNLFNEPEKEFEYFHAVWANRADVSTSESMRAQEIGAQLSVRFTVRWSEKTATVDERFRIRHDGKEFDITGVREIARQQWLEITGVVRAESSEVFEVTSP